MIKRAISEKILQLAGKYPVVSVTGPRQSGKTTLVRDIFPEYRYVSLERPPDRALAEEDPEAFLQGYEKGIIIDEAQYVPGLFSYIQVLADERKRNGEFVLTGSQHFLFMEKVTQSLAGRVAVFNLLPFSFEEIKNTSWGNQDYEHYLFKGFFPRLYDQEIAPPDFYPNYIQTYTERDVRQLVNISDLSAFQRFLQICAGRIGQLVNLSQIGTDLGIDHKTVSRWLSILQTGFQAFLLQPYFENYNKRILKTPKLYFYDTGLACSLLGIQNREQLDAHFAKGALFENYVVVELMKQFFNKGLRPQFYFWRDSSGHEVDLLVDFGGKLFPIEIKSGRTLNSSFFNGLDFFHNLAGLEPRDAYLIYGGTENQNRSRANVRPWNQLPVWNV
ncbi:MAG: ATP-binding protein [Saprospiraceae bacterium]|jgi:predicted AAA+ superfamily ATPase|nr:ATP-binding protein [Saprospiraceae bacterium]